MFPQAAVCVLCWLAPQTKVLCNDPKLGRIPVSRCMVSLITWKEEESSCTAGISARPKSRNAPQIMEQDKMTITAKTENTTTTGEELIIERNYDSNKKKSGESTDQI